MDIFDVLELLLGLSLFLFGMNIMGDSLREMAEKGLRDVLERLTSSRVRGIFLGTLVTAVIQSSSATTVMVVSLVNSGVMALSAAVGVIMGANVGTAFTSWITALSGIEGGEAVGSVLVHINVLHHEVIHFIGVAVHKKTVVYGVAFDISLFHIAVVIEPENGYLAGVDSTLHSILLAVAIEVQHLNLHTLCW